MNVEYNSGDEVRFLNEVGGGIIVKKINKNLYMVRTDDGFEYPVDSSELVCIKAAKKEDNRKKEVVENVEKILLIKEEDFIEEVVLKSDDDIRISLAWVPADGSETFDGKLDLFIVNDSNYFLFFHVLKFDDCGLFMIDAGKLEPNLKIEIGRFNRNDINILKSIQIQLILHGHKRNAYKPILEKRFDVKPVKFFNQSNYSTNDFFDVPAFFMDVICELPVNEHTAYKMEEIKNLLVEQEQNDEIEKSQKYKARPKPEALEIDLHINVLKESVVGMTNSEILNFQMQHFHHMLTEAIEQKIAKIVFIHGIGNGTLRDTLRESLDSQYKLQYEDASFREYGFGATLVFVK